jgi:hypothetical protein
VDIGIELNVGSEVKERERREEGKRRWRTYVWNVNNLMLT